MNNVFFKILIILSSAIILTSCESILTKDKIEKKYANATINSFVKDRYTCPRFNKFSDRLKRLNSYLNDNRTPQPDNRQLGAYADYVDRILGDGKSVIYPAPFTSINDTFLYKPVDEMCRFCKAQGGILFMKKRFSKSLESLDHSPKASFFASYCSVRFYHIPYSNITMAEITYNPIFLMNIPIDTSSDLDTMLAKHGFSPNDMYINAYTQNAFGIYVCRHATSGKPLWGVTIRPIAYYPKNPYDSLSADMLLVLITPIDK